MPAIRAVATLPHSLHIQADYHLTKVFPSVEVMGAELSRNLVVCLTKCVCY